MATYTNRSPGWLAEREAMNAFHNGQTTTVIELANAADAFAKADRELEDALRLLGDRIGLTRRWLQEARNGGLAADVDPLGIVQGLGSRVDIACANYRREEELLQDALEKRGYLK